MDAKRNSSFAAKIKKGVRNMRSTFNILFYVNKSKEKGGTTRLSVSGRVPTGGERCCVLPYFASWFYSPQGVILGNDLET